MAIKVLHCFGLFELSYYRITKQNNLEILKILKISNSFHCYKCKTIKHVHLLSWEISCQPNCYLGLFHLIQSFGVFIS